MSSCGAGRSKEMASVVVPNYVSTPEKCVEDRAWKMG